MEKTAPPFAENGARITVSGLRRHAEGWLLDCEIRQHSGRTLEARRSIVAKLLWFLQRGEYLDCGASELRGFLAYVTRGHEQPGGRWGSARLTRAVRPATVATYHRHLRTLFRWLVQEGVLGCSPMEKIAAPVSRPDQVQPFAQAQVAALMAAARKSRHPLRDEAILCVLLDTGLRASEICSLRVRDLDLTNRRFGVLGKGNKRRGVFFGKASTKALYRYLSEAGAERDEDSFLFRADRGRRAEEGLTRSGLLQLIERLGRAARIESARCSPHTFRHTFAVEFLRNGGNVFSLQTILGHTGVQMTSRYVALAQADIACQQRQFSPVDRLKRG